MDKKILTLFIFAVFMFSGCLESVAELEQGNIQEIHGIPISIETAYAENWDAIALIIKIDQTNEHTICQNTQSSAKYGNAIWLGKNVLRAAAIIKSEINDNDNESITLIGEYINGIFYFTSVTANGITIKAWDVW